MTDEEILNKASLMLISVISSQDIPLVFNMTGMIILNKEDCRIWTFIKKEWIKLSKEDTIKYLLEYENCIGESREHFKENPGFLVPRDILLRTVFGTDKDKKTISYKTRNKNDEIAISRTDGDIMISFEQYVSEEWNRCPDDDYAYVNLSIDEVRWLIHCLEGFIK